MDLAELNNHRLLIEDLEEAKALYATTSAKAIGAQTLTGMPHGTGVSDKAGYLGAALADISGQIAYLQKQIDDGAGPIEEFIAGIDSLRLRLIFRYRFLHNYSWMEVAGMLERGTTEAAVKSACYDYLLKINET